MLYVVSGFRRSGTSMMMRALKEGLHEGQVIYRPDLEKGNKEIEGYRPNPHGNWEVGSLYYLNPSFLREVSKIDNGLIKIFFDGLYLLPKGEYKILYMLRDQEEINHSVDRVEAHLKEVKIPRNNLKKPFSVYSDYDQEDIDHVLGICEMRQDFDMHFIQYRDVIENPRKVFESLDMPIDVDICVSTIEPSLYRFKRSEHDYETADEGACTQANDSASEERRAG